MPNWIKWIIGKLGEAWSWFGQASRAFTFLKLVGWLTGISVASIVTGLLAHATRVLAFFSTMSPAVWFAVFGGVFLLVLAAVLAVLQWTALRYRPAWLSIGPPSAEHTRLAEHMKEAEELRAENQRLTERGKGLLSHIEHVEGVSRRYFEKLTFGEALPEPKRYGRPGFEQAFDRLYELRPSLRALVAETDRVWSNLSAMIRARESDLPWRMLAWRLDRVERGERSQFAQAANAFETVLEVREGDPRPYLTATYNTYRRLRNQIAEVARAFGHPVALVTGAIEWRDVERRFLEILERKLEMPGLENAKEARHIYDEKHGPPEDIFTA